MQRRDAMHVAARGGEFIGSRGFQMRESTGTVAGRLVIQSDIKLGEEARRKAIGPPRRARRQGASFP